MAVELSKEFVEVNKNLEKNSDCIIIFSSVKLRHKFLTGKLLNLR